MDDKLNDLVNDQINKELYSAYLYLEMADYYKDAGLDGFATYFEIQAQEERDHALIFRKYLLENDKVPKLLAIDAPGKTYNSYIEPLDLQLEHEQFVTSLINDIYAAALDAKDFRLQQFMKWFIDEQMEEEDNARDMITKMTLFGKDQHSLFELDKEYGSRVYSVPSPLATA